MDATVASISINLVSSFIYDLAKCARGVKVTPIDSAVARTVERFPAVEGLKDTLRQWLLSPGVLDALEAYAKGLRGFDPIKIDVLAAALISDTQFFLPESAATTAQEIVSAFFSEVRTQYLSDPKLAMQHVANRIEEGISVSAAGFDALRSDVKELKESLPNAARESAGSVIDLQIDEGREYLRRHEHDLAREAWEKLRKNSWDRASDRQKFRILSNLAIVSARQERLSAAARLFIEAKDFQPDDAIALANEAHAYYLLGDNTRSFSLATQVKQRFPNSSQALTIWLSSAPPDFGLKDLEDAIPAQLSDDAEVLLALARRAVMARNYDKAETLASRASAINEDWSYPWALLGESIFRSTLPDTAEDFGRIGSPSAAARLKAAWEACDKAIELSKKERQVSVRAGALVIRSEVRRILDDPGSDEDIVAAWSLQPDDPTVLRDYARMTLRQGRKREAIEKLRTALAHEERSDLRMLLGVTLSSIGEPGSRDEAIQVFSRLISDSEPGAIEIRTQAVIAALDAIVRDQRWEQARQFISQLPVNALSDTASAALTGGLELAAGERVRASEYATVARDSITEASSRDDTRLVADLLADLGRHRDALFLWERLASSTSLGYYTSRFIDCALRVGEHGLFLTFCAQLRANGVYDPQLIKAEAGIRGQYDTEATISLLKEYLNRAPDDRNARLQLSVLGVQLGRPALVSSDPASMPAPEDTEAGNWKTMVLVMRSGGFLLEALKFAYRLLRLHFGKVEAHRAYLAATLTTDPMPDIPVPEVAGPGTAVAFMEEGSNQTEWRVLEEEFAPDPGLQEVGPNHFIAQQLAGKRIGDSFLLARGSVVSQRATVLQVVSKYVYRFQDCGQNWLKRFPDHPDVQPVRVSKPGAGGKEEIDLAEFFRSFDRITAHQQHAIEIYREHPIPIHMVAELLNHTDFEQTVRMAVDNTVRIRCCAGNAQERAGSLAALRNASAVVLDLTAIATLSLLDAVDDLATFQTSFLVSELTIAELRQDLGQLAGDKPRSHLGREGYRYVWVDATPDAVRAQREYLESVIEKIRERCTVVGCPELASVPPDKRASLIKAVGEHGAQSMVLAAEPGRVLWTDDYVFAVLAMHEFGVRRVWTQIALQERAEAGKITSEAFVEATAKLLGWRYYFTSPSVPALSRAGAMADWNPDRWPLKSALEVYGDPAIATADALGFAFNFIPYYMSEVVLPEVRNAVTVRILDHLAGRGEGLAPVGTLLRFLPRAFGLNVIHANELTNVVNAWIASKRR